MTQGPANAHKMRLSNKLSQRPGTHAIRERSRERVASGRGHMQAPIGFRASGISWIRPKFTASGAPDKYPSSDTENGNTEHRSGHSDRRPLTLGTLGTTTRKATPITEFKSAARDTLRTAREKAEPYRWLIFRPTPPGLPPHQAGFIFALRSPRREPQDRNPRSSLRAARYRRPKRTPCPAPSFSHRQRCSGGYAATVNGR